MRELDTFEAEQFAQMLLAGVPSLTAVAYFHPEGTSEDELKRAATYWPRKRSVAEAMTRLQGGNWLQMKPEERIELALKKHYNEMAFFLYSHNYAELDGMKKAKADTAREVLEKKLAGLAGQLDPLQRFYQDLIEGRVSLSRPPAAVKPIPTA